MKSHPQDASETQRQDKSHDDFSKAFYGPHHAHARKIFEVLENKFCLINIFKSQILLLTLYSKGDQKGIIGTCHMWFILLHAQNNWNST